MWFTSTKEEPNKPVAYFPHLPNSVFGDEVFQTIKKIASGHPK
jgi:hypothetical protein